MTAVQPQHIHLIAACGTGMGSLAGMLKARGYHVTGSDQHVYPPMSTQLQAWGIPLYNGFNAEHLVPRPDLVIVGNAVSRDNPEAMATEQAGIPVMSFPQALAHFFIQERHSVVVTGTHGKSTTTALIAWLLQHAGYEPGFFVGAVMRNIDGSFGLGQGPHFVVEGDEYDSAYFDKGPKFLHYRPRTAVLTSLEFDHADIYRDLDHVRSAFARFIPLLPSDGCLVACHDAPHVRELLATVPIAAPIQTYGLESGAEWQVVAWHADATGTHLTVHHHGQPFGSFTSPLFGPHNVQNVLAAVVVAQRLGLSPGADRCRPGYLCAHQTALRSAWRGPRHHGSRRFRTSSNGGARHPGGRTSGLSWGTAVGRLRAPFRHEPACRVSARVCPGVPHRRSRAHRRCLPPQRTVALRGALFT